MGEELDRLSSSQGLQLCRLRDEYALAEDYIWLWPWLLLCS